MHDVNALRNNHRDGQDHQLLVILKIKIILLLVSKAGPALRGAAPHFGGLVLLLLTIHTPMHNLITTFLTNSSRFQLKSMHEVL